MEKKNKIVDFEPIEEKDITITDPVEIPEVNNIKLIIDIGFNDKFTGVNYKIGDEVLFEKRRAEELLNDPRKLVRKK